MVPSLWLCAFVCVCVWQDENGHSKYGIKEAFCYHNKIVIKIKYKIGQKDVCTEKCGKCFQNANET